MALGVFTLEGWVCPKCNKVIHTTALTCNCGEPAVHVVPAICCVEPFSTTTQDYGRDTVPNNDESL